MGGDFFVGFPRGNLQERWNKSFAGVRKIMAWVDCGNYWLHTAPQGSAEWLEVRKGRPSGSIVGAILGHSQFSTPDDELDYLSMVREKKFSPAQLKNMNHGTLHEDEARKHYERIFRVTVGELGFVVPKWEPRIGVSVDGVVGDDGLVEIKCPRRMYPPLLERCGEGENPDSKIYKTHYDQMQMGMYVLGRKWCDYVVYSTSQELIHIRRVHRAVQEWDASMSVVRSFLDHRLSPRLRDSVYPLMPPAAAEDALVEEMAALAL